VRAGQRASRDRYQQFLKQFYGSHRRALFRVLKTLDFSSTTSDQALIEAMNFIMAHEQNPKIYLEATIELPFASAKWLRTVMVRRKRKSWFRRQHLEACVFSYGPVSSFLTVGYNVPYKGLLGPPTNFTTLSPKNAAESIW
jgi:hypothetical protein